VLFVSGRKKFNLGPNVIPSYKTTMKQNPMEQEP